MMRSGRSCETHLFQFIYDLHKNLDGTHNIDHKQTGLIIIMDFAKAVDRVQHTDDCYMYWSVMVSIMITSSGSLLGNLDRVVHYGVSTDPAPVLSGIP